jgi:hypothetical protein
MDNAAEGNEFMKRPSWYGSTALLGLTLLATFPGGVAAQSSGAFAKYEAILQREQPETYELVIRLERMQGLLFGELVAEGQAVRSSAERLPSPTFEVDMLDKLGLMATEEGTLDEIADQSKAGYASLGERAATIIEWTSDFRRAILGILADPTLTEFAARRAAIAEALAVYQSRPEVALPTRPKNMDVLYQHGQALDFRTGYADLDGLIWAGHWLKMAVTKPLIDFSGAELTAGIDTVHARYYAKLTYGEPPDFFPSELPLAPAIAPELSFLSSEAVAIWDNLSMLEEVIADNLVSAEVTDEVLAVETAVNFFLDPNLGVADPIEFGAMALRHGIFFQGGFPLAVMRESERNSGGHAAHFGGGASNMTFPGM